ncbi:polysaccharide deacetylase family protein [Actinoallomurus vinaceus]|uniref:Polysaccharide deacetylase family protein n=2 Tax=Actinoallomurus vinaceus TaxID=1080074 RepID=A0ABP8UG90_9ACTN
MPPSRRAVLAAMAAGALAGCAGPSGTARGGRSGTGVPRSEAASGGPSLTPRPAVAHTLTRSEVVARYGRRKPHTWGFDAPGTVRALPTRGAIALTFDACGGPGGSGYDQKLIDFLRRREVPATLFINSRWIDANPAVFRRLAREPLFEIANHGTRHRPLSVTGRSAYGIAGTRSSGEVYDEVAGNHVKLTRLLGFPPRFFRSGTAYCDDVAARIVTNVGERFVGFSVNGDAGATYTPAEVHHAVGSAADGSIVICHMNRPKGGTAEGIAAAVPRLLAAGHHFVRLSDQLH